MSYPEECPAFEVLRHLYEEVPVGSVMVGRIAGGEYRPLLYLASDIDDDASPGPWFFYRSEVRPLTRAAREMLAIVDYDPRRL